MSDDTRAHDDDAFGPEPDRTAPGFWRDAVLPADLGEQIDHLRSEGEVILALALPWSEAVGSILNHYEQTVASLRLDDEVHYQLGRASGIAQLGDLLDTLSLVASDAM